jgi:uncharacterized protein involved in exopolysaccharide biosynthesis
MQQNTNDIQNIQEDEISLKELILKIKDWYRFLLSKWIVLVAAGIIGGAIGVGYATNQKPTYTARLSFVLEDEKSGGVSGLSSIVNQFGGDFIGNAGGAFAAANLAELMRSRLIIEKTLLSPVVLDNEKVSLADYFIRCNNLQSILGLKDKFTNNQLITKTDWRKFNLSQDGILNILYSKILGEISIYQKDKKGSISVIEVKNINENFAKLFCERIAEETSNYYIEIKSKKARQNMEILQHQVDSVRAELNGAITGVATAADNTFGLNPAMMVRKSPGTRRQVDVQANTAILTQLVTNLEMAKVSLRKETPLIQLIDKPRLPLDVYKVSKLKFLILGIATSIFFAALIILVVEKIKQLVR